MFCDTDEETFTIDPHRNRKKDHTGHGRHRSGSSLWTGGRHGRDHGDRKKAQSMGAWKIAPRRISPGTRGNIVGTFGDAATFSFYPGKNLGAYGDAGCVVTNDDRLADWMTTFARHGGKGDHIMEGINSRMDGLQAAILNAKLPHLPAWTRGAPPCCRTLR